MSYKDPRPGEVVLDFDPTEFTEAGVVFIGHIRSPWRRGDCPKNIGQARERGGETWIEMDPRYVQGLEGLEVGRHVVLVYWMQDTRRDIILQSPGHVDGTRGVFALRTPLRPNPLAMSSVTITSIDVETGRVGIDAIDCFDGTPLVDMKPWLPSIDVPPCAAD